MARTLLIILAVALALLVLGSWSLASERRLEWFHLLGLGVSLALLAVLFFGRGVKQPEQPPP